MMARWQINDNVKTSWQTVGGSEMGIEEYGVLHLRGIVIVLSTFYGIRTRYII